MLRAVLAFFVCECTSAHLTAPSPPLENSIATDETTMNGSNEDVNIRSSRRVSAVAAATISNKRSKGHKTFDERIKDLMSFKAEFGHCNVPQTKSKNNKHLSLGYWCNNMRMSYKAIKEGRSPGRKLSKADSSVLRMQGFLGASTIHYPKSISLIKMFFTCSCSYEYAYVLL